MPELPEIQTTVSGLQLIINKHITNIKINTKKLRYLVPKKIIKISINRKIIKVYRIAKYVLLELSGNVTLIFHLGMSGRIRLLTINDYKVIKHDHILIYLNQKSVLVFNDPRKFGFIDYSKSSNLKNKKYLVKLGLDPFDKKLNKDYLLSNFKNSKSSIKQLLLNQRIISGIGNIYACEILYDARISPLILGCQLNIGMIEKLLISIRKILDKAILSGGTTIRNYESIDGTLGNFQTKFKVYNRENKKILNHRIKRIKQSGRSTFYCPNIQKNR